MRYHHSYKPRNITATNPGTAYGCEACALLATVSIQHHNTGVHRENAVVTLTLLTVLRQVPLCVPLAPISDFQTQQPAALLRTIHTILLIPAVPS
jgi:hypothetical protein